MRVTSNMRQNRRDFVRFGMAAVMCNTWLGRARADSDSAAVADQVTIENFSTSGKPIGVVRTPKTVKTDADWQRQLSPLAYRVTRHAGTEVAYSGAYASTEADGLYRCVCCNTALFDSRTKFESGTGWPSFWQPITKLNIVTNSDYSLFMERDAVSCRLCDAHLGHVFDDGPRPTGLRYCINSVALLFAARG